MTKRTSKRRTSKRRSKGTPLVVHRVVAMDFSSPYLVTAKGKISRHRLLATAKRRALALSRSHDIQTMVWQWKGRYRPHTMYREGIRL